MYVIEEFNDKIKIEKWIFVSLVLRVWYLILRLCERKIAKMANINII